MKFISAGKLHPNLPHFHNFFLLEAPLGPSVLSSATLESPRHLTKLFLLLSNGFFYNQSFEIHAHISKIKRSFLNSVETFTNMFFNIFIKALVSFLGS